MEVTVAHNYPGMNGQVTVTALIDGGLDVPMKPLVALATQYGGATLRGGERSLVLTATIPVSDRKAADCACALLRERLRQIRVRQH